MTATPRAGHKDGAVAVRFACPFALLAAVFAALGILGAGCGSGGFDVLPGANHARTHTVPAREKRSLTRAPVV